MPDQNIVGVKNHCPRVAVRQHEKQQKSERRTGYAMPPAEQKSDVRGERQNHQHLKHGDRQRCKQQTDDADRLELCVRSLSNIHQHRIARRKINERKRAD